MSFFVQCDISFNQYIILFFLPMSIVWWFNPQTAYLEGMRTSQGTFLYFFPPFYNMVLVLVLYLGLTCVIQCLSLSLKYCARYGWSKWKGTYANTKRYTHTFLFIAYHCSFNFEPFNGSFIFSQSLFFLFLSQSMLSFLRGIDKWFSFQLKKTKINNIGSFEKLLWLSFWK